MKKIEFNDVNFSYNNISHVYHNNLNFVMNVGKCYLVAGKNGSGKSTIIGIITRIWDEYSGEILIDKKDLRTYSKERLVEEIGVCFQKPPIFHDTIENNITMGRKLVIDEYIKMINFEQDLKDMERNMDSELESGNNLSGGQSQKIGILRTICIRHSIYIFDEPTSNLDRRSKEQFYNLITVLKREAIVVLFSHEPDAVSYADEVIEI